VSERVWGWKQEDGEGGEEEDRKDRCITERSERNVTNKLWGAAVSN
jgi:hypothetical protein